LSLRAWTPVFQSFRSVLGESVGFVPLPLVNYYLAVDAD
jgi:hypothetical protein